MQISLRKRNNLIFWWVKHREGTRQVPCLLISRYYENQRTRSVRQMVNSKYLECFLFSLKRFCKDEYFILILHGLMFELLIQINRQLLCLVELFVAVSWANIPYPLKEMKSKPSRIIPLTTVRIHNATVYLSICKNYTFMRMNEERYILCMDAYILVRRCHDMRKRCSSYWWILSEPEQSGQLPLASMAATLCAVCKPYNCKLYSCSKAFRDIDLYNCNLTTLIKLLMPYPQVFLILYL